MSVLLVLVALVGVLPWWPTRRPRPRTRDDLRARARPRPRAAVDVAVLLDLAAAAIAAGASVPAALQALGRAIGDDDGAGRALRRAGVGLVLGASWAQAWAGAPAAVRELAQALEPAWVDGADPGPLIARAAAAVRARRQRQAHEDAARLGVRLVLPLGLCLLPAFVLLGLVPVLLSAGGSLLGP